MPKPQDRALSRYAKDALALLGDSIRVARLEQRLGMTAAAERAGISRALLRRIESGDPGASIGAVFEAAAVVGVPLFEADHDRLAGHLAHRRDKLALLPSSARPRRPEAADDDF